MTTQTVDPTTGEIVEKPAAEIIPTDDASRYAALCDEISATMLEYDDRVRHLIATDLDPDHGAWIVEQHLKGLHAERETILDRWREALDSAAPGTAIDTPRVRVLKPRPRETWRLAKSAKDIARESTYMELLDLIDSLLDDETTPRQLGDAIIAWLGPERHESALGDLRVTVRPPEVRS